MPAIIAWIVGSRVGRWVAFAFAIAMALLAALAAARRAGAKAAKEKLRERRLQAVKKRKQIDDDVNSLDDTELSDRLGKWVRGPDR